MSQTPISVNYSLEEILKDINSKLDKIDNKFETKFDTLDKKFETKFDKFENKLDALDHKFETKLDALDKKFETKFDKIDERLTSVEIGQTKLTEKVEGMHERLKAVEGTQRNQVWALIVLLAGAIATAGFRTFFMGNP